VLLLAAFSRSLDDEGFVGQFRVGSSTERHIPREKFEVELRPVEEALLRDIELPVIRIGGKRDDAVLRLKVADRFWYNAFQEMSIGATAILVVPGIGKSLLRELAAICGRQDLRDKTLLIQPGGFELSEKHLERIGLPIDAPVESWPRSKRQEHWQPIVQRVRETTGVELPRWNVDGQIVSLADPEHRAPCTSEGLKTLLADIGPGLSLDAGLNRVRLMIRNKERGVQ
jgi:hypothetical protein